MFAKIQGLFERVVASIEGDKTPLSRYFQLFFAILAVRLMLEFYSNHRRFEIDDIIHIGLWFSFIVLAFLLQLKAFSGEKIVRVSKLVVVCFTIALTAPIIDLLFFGGKGVKMNYLAIHSWQDLLWSYVTIGGSSLSRGATPGIRVEIVLLMIASFNYIRTKTASLGRAFLGAFSIYTVLFFSGTLPKAMNWLVLYTGIGYAESDQSTVLMLLGLDLSLIMVCMALYMRGQLGSILKHARWTGVGIAVLLFFGGFFWSLSANPGRMEWNATTIFFPFLWLLISGCLLFLHALWVQGHDGRRAKDALLIMALLCGFAISDKIFFMVMVFWGAGFLLNERPLQLFRVPLLGQFLISLQMGSVILMGWMAAGGILVGYPVEVLGLQVLGGMFALMATESLKNSTIAGIIRLFQPVSGRQWIVFRLFCGLFALTLIAWSLALMK